METITNKTTAETIINRINSLSEISKPLWGKMTVYQMLKHCIMWEEMAMGKPLYKQSFLGKLVGKFALKDMMKDEPVKRNLPTVPSFKINGDGDVMACKKELTALIAAHVQYTDKGFMHPFFGDLSAEEAGVMDYKHLDHHLRQFGV